MADEVIALEFALDAGKANMTLGELEKGFEAMAEEIKTVGRGTKQFKTLSKGMAQASKEIKNMELAFEGLDREQVAGEIGSVAGAVGDLTTSFILLGGESETMEELGRNIEKAMMVSMGLKGAIEGLSSTRKLYNNLIKDGTIQQVKETITTSIATAKTWLLDAAKKAYAVTTGVLTGKIKIATVAQRVFNAVIKASPIALLITGIAAAGAAFLAFAKDSSEAAKEQKALKDSLESVKGEIESVHEEVAEMENAFALAKEGVMSKEKALFIYNETIGQTIGEAETLEEAEKRFHDNTENYIKAATLRAQAQELIKMAAEEQTAALLAQEKDNRSTTESTLGGISEIHAAYKDLTSFGVFGYTDAEAEATKKTKEEATKRAVAQSEANAKRFQELAKNLDAEALLIEKNNNFITEADRKKAEADKKAAEADKKAAEEKAERRAKRLKDQQEAAKKLIEDAKALAEFEEEQARISIQLIQDEGERARAEIDYNTQLELEALEKKGELTFDAEMLIAQKKHKALADLQKEEDDKRFAAEKEAQAKRDEYEKLLFEAKVGNEKEETERKRLQLEEDFQNNIATLEQQGLLSTELEIELTMAREKALADIELERIEKVRQANLEATQERLESANQIIGAISSLNSAALATDLKNAGNNEKKKEQLRRASFEREKKLNIAMALVNGAQAQMSILAQTPKADFGIATAIAMAAAAVTTIAQIAAIKATSYQGGGSPVASESATAPSAGGAGAAGGGAAITPVSNTSTILGSQQVFVTETDITNTQNNVSVIEESATF